MIHSESTKKVFAVKELLFLIIICATIFLVFDRMATCIENGFKDDPRYLRYNAQLKTKRKGR